MRRRGFQFLVYPGDHNPAHVHVRKAGCSIKVEFADSVVRARNNIGFSEKEVSRIIALVEENQQFLLQSWEAING